MGDKMRLYCENRKHRSLISLCYTHESGGGILSFSKASKTFYARQSIQIGGIWNGELCEIWKENRLNNTWLKICHVISMRVRVGSSHIMVNTHVLFILPLGLLRGRCVLCLVLHFCTNLTIFFVLLTIVLPNCVARTWWCHIRDVCAPNQIQVLRV